MKNYAFLMKLSLLAIIFINGCADHDEELEKIPEYMELTKLISSSDQFKNFPPMLSWMFLIDGKKHGDGPLVFDKEEPGYLAGLSRGMKFSLEHFKDTLTVELLEEIRQHSTRDVKKINDTKFTEKIGGNSIQFKLSFASNTTEDGLKELKNKLIGDSLRSVDKDKDGDLVLRRSYAEREVLYPLVKEIIDTYEKSSKSIRDIAKLCQDLDQLHPFNDGNVRTFVINLMQKELARNKHTPSILYDPNRFDAHSLDELEKEILSGQNRYRSHLKK